MKITIWFFFVVFAVFFCDVVFAQQEEQRATVHIEHADYMEGSERFGKNVQALFGNVRFRHHKTLMHCDSAFFYRDSNKVNAYGSIHIIQNDSINLYGDILYYIGNEDKAMVRENVRLVNKNVTLTTEFLDYDRKEDVAYYYNGGKVASGQNELVSDWGYYFPRSEEAHFRQNVVVSNPDYKMYSDTLLYYTIPEIIKIVGPTKIISERNEIYSELGFYDTQKDIAQLELNSSIKGKEQQLDGDTIYYDRNTGFGEVFSNMFLRDTINHIIIGGDYGYYNELTQEALVTKRAVLMQIQNSDTLYLHADTLRSDPIDSTEFQMVRAYHNVKFFRHDLQGRCDSMVYESKDSTNTFYKDPVIWANNNQMSASIIKFYSRNRAFNKAELIDNAFVIGPEDTTSYNQIKGRKMTGYIKDNKLYRIDVEGNGQTIYYPKEDGAIIGVNKAEASNLTILLEEQQVTGIILRNQPAGNLNPPNLVTKEQSRLNGFRWLDNYRPKEMKDIFIKQEFEQKNKTDVDFDDFHFDITMPGR